MWWDRKRCSRQFTRALNAVPAHYFHPHNFLRVLYRSFCNVSTHSPPLRRKTGEFCRVQGFVISQILRFDAPQKRSFFMFGIFSSRLPCLRWRRRFFAGRFCRTGSPHNKKTKGVFRLPEHSENASRLSDQGEKTIRFTLEKKQIENIIFSLCRNKPAPLYLPFLTAGFY